MIDATIAPGANPLIDALLERLIDRLEAALDVAAAADRDQRLLELTQACEDAHLFARAVLRIRSADALDGDR